MGTTRLCFVVAVSTLLMILAGIKEAEGKAPYYDFVLQESNFTRLCNTKTMVTVNGQFPGPTITVTKGQTFYVNVRNNASFGITIHWHGVKQPRNPWSDGPENITQCPIEPGTNFTYMVVLSNEEGTLWWHAHNDWSRATVHGAIVVLPPNRTYHRMRTPYEYQTIILGSWYNGDARLQALNAYKAGSDPGKSDGYTINGQPGDGYDCSNETMYTMQVTAGKTYLLRLINAVVNEEMWFGIANHKLTVTGQDAAYVKQFTTDYVMITPGQTMDVLVTTNQTPGYYYMLATPFVNANQASFSTNNTRALIQYSTVTTRPATIPLPTLPGRADDAIAENFTSQIKSLDSYGHYFDIPRTVNREIVIAISINFLTCTDPECNPTGIAIGASANNRSYIATPISILEAYSKNLNGVYTTDFPDNLTGIDFNRNFTLPESFTVKKTSVKLLNYNDRVQIVFQGTNFLSAGSHPMHIHGYSFYVVGKGKGNYNSTTDPQNFDLTNPPLINTFAVPKNGWIAVRFVANNPGVWFIHCHIDKHALWGMETVLIVRNGRFSWQKMLPPPTSMPRCST